MQLSKMQNKMNGSLVTIQFHIKCTNPLYPKFTSIIFSVYIFCCNFYLIIAYVLIPTTDKCSHPFVSNCLNTVTTYSTKCTDMAYPSQYDNILEVKH